VLKRLFCCALVVLLSASCATWAEEAVPFTGTWQSEAYGMYMVVGGDGVRIYEYTSASCVKVLEASASGVDEFLRLEDGRLLLGDLGGSRVFDGIESLPETCSETFRSDDPSWVLEVLSTTFEEHYAFLDERDPEWEAHVAEAQSRLSEGMSPSELLEVVEELLGDLADPQVLLVPEEGLIDDITWSAGPENEVVELLGERIAAGTGLASVEESGETQDSYVVGRLPGGIGYLGLLQLLALDVDSAASEEVLLQTLDDLVAALQAEEAPGLIIDLRDNYGGLEEFAMATASRFISEEVAVLRHEVRIGGTNDYLDRGEISVAPNPGGTFDGPVVVLVGPGTEGAAEWLVLALMKSPNVVAVGEATAGSMSPLFVRVLPNGWAVNVPNERVYDTDGGLWGLAGIPPDEEVETTVAQLQAGEDPVLEWALELLQG